MSQTQSAQNFWDQTKMSLHVLAKRLFVLTFVFMVVVFVSACSGVTTYSAQPIERAPLNLPNPEPASLEQVEWKLVTEENIRDVLTEINESGEKRILFALSQSDFERMVENLQELGTVVILYRETLDQYRVYYESPTKE